MDGTGQRKSLRDVYQVVFRRWSLFLLSAALFATISLYAAHLVPVKYTGTARFERRRAVTAAQEDQKNIESFDTIRLTLEPELMGYQAMRLLVSDLELTKGWARDSQGGLTKQSLIREQELIQELRASVKLRFEVKSEMVDVISVSVTHSDPLLAQTIPNTLVLNYREGASRRSAERLTADKLFLQEQVSTCSEDLKIAMTAKYNFEQKYSRVLPDNPGALQERIQQITDELRELRREQNSAGERIARLRALGASGGDSTSRPADLVWGPNPDLKKIEEELRRTKESLESALLISRMTENHPTVKMLKARIEQLEKQKSETPAETILQRVVRAADQSQAYDVAVVIAAIQGDMLNREDRIQRLDQQLVEYEDLMRKFATIRQEYTTITEDVKRKETDLDNWQKRLVEVDGALQAEAAKRRVLWTDTEVAREQYRPSFPSLALVLAFAIFGGLGFGGALVFLFNAMDRTITSPEEAARHFRVPVHGVIGEIATRGDRSKKALKRWVLTPIISLIVLCALGAVTLSIVLWLRYPDQYKQWEASRSHFIYQLILGDDRGTGRGSV